jgi:hypothetical protein
MKEIKAISEKWICNYFDRLKMRTVGEKRCLWKELNYCSSDTGRRKNSTSSRDAPHHD